MKRLGMRICLLLLAATGCDAADPDDEPRVLEDAAVIAELDLALAASQMPEADTSVPPTRDEQLASFDDGEDAVDEDVDALASEVDPDEMRWQCADNVCCRDCGWNVCCCVYISGEWVC